MPRLAAGLFSYLSAYSGLTDLVGDRIHPVKRPDGDPLPAVSFQKVSGPRGYTLTGPDGRLRANYQFSCWGAVLVTKGALIGARNVAAQVIAAFDGFAGMMGDVEVQSAFVTNDNDDYEEDFGIHHVVVEVSITYSAA